MKKRGNDRYIDLMRHRLCMAGHQAKKRSKVRGAPYDLDTQYLGRLLDENDRRCALTNIPFAPPIGAASAKTVSIDRIRPELGYVKGNIRLILHGLNCLKGARSDDEELLEICEAVVRTLKGDGRAQD